VLDLDRICFRVGMVVGEFGRLGFFRIDLVLTGVPRALVARQRTEHHRDALANQLGRGIRMTVWGHFPGEFLDLLKAKFLVRHLTSPEAEGDLHLHFLAEEVDGVTELHAKVMRIDLRAELDFFDLVRMLMLAGLFILLGLLVAEFAKINQTADRWDGSSSDLNEINTFGSGEVDGIGERDDSKLLAVGSDDAHFAGANLSINPDCGTRRERGTGRERTAQDTPNG